MSGRYRTSFLALGVCLGIAASASAETVNLASVLGNFGFEGDTTHSQWQVTRPTAAYLSSVPVNPNILPLNPAFTDGTTLPALAAPAGSKFIGVRNPGDLDAKGKLVHNVLTRHYRPWTVFQVTIWANRARCCSTLNSVFPDSPSDVLVEFLGWGAGDVPLVRISDDCSRKPAIQTQTLFSNWGSLGQWTSQTFSFTTNVDLEYITLAIAGRNQRRDSYVAFDVDPTVPTATGSPCGPSQQFAIFAFNDAEIGAHAHIAGGLIGSSKRVLIGNAAIVPGVRVDGPVSDRGNATYNGDVISSRDVSLGNGSIVNGSVHASRDVLGGPNALVTGSVYAGRNVPIGDAQRIHGNVHSGRDVTDGLNATVHGRVEARNLITTSATVTGPKRDKTNTPRGSPEPPLVYTQIFLSTPKSFVTGLSGDVVIPIGATFNLAPGYYGQVNLGADSSTTLSSGQYYLAALKTGSGASLNLNLNGGAIAILVDGDVDLLANLAVTVNGAQFGDILTAAWSGDSAIAHLAERVYLETRGSFQLGSGGRWFGAVYAPLGRISLGDNAAAIGALAGGDKIILKNGTEMFFVPSCGCLSGPVTPSVEGSFD